MSTPAPAPKKRTAPKKQAAPAPASQSATPPTRKQTVTKKRAAAKSGLATARTVGGAAGAAAGAGTYLKERHTQKKQERGERRVARERAQESTRLAGARASGRATAKPFLIRDMPRKTLLAEFTVCSVIVLAGAVVAPQGAHNGTTRAMVKLTGLSALFFVLALVSAGGKGPAKAAGSFGLLVTVAYLFTSSDAVNLAKWTAGFFGPTTHAVGNQFLGAGAANETLGGDVSAAGLQPVAV
jgi:hypothetical protein